MLILYAYCTLSLTLFSLAMAMWVHPREDYKALIWLSFLLLGRYLGKWYKFRAPGAFHQARWMAKGPKANALKIFVFWGQEKLTHSERVALLSMQDMSLFMVFLYSNKWNRGTRGTERGIALATIFSTVITMDDGRGPAAAFAWPPPVEGGGQAKERSPDDLERSICGVRNRGFCL